MGAGKSTLGAEIADRLGRRLVDLDREVERAAGRALPEIFEQRGEVEFRVLEAEATIAALENERPAVLALGGGAIETPRIRRALRERALTVYLDVDPETAWGRVQGTGRPLAGDEQSFRALYDRRQALYREAADATATSAEEVVLAAAGIVVEEDGLARLPELVAGREVELVVDSTAHRFHQPPLEDVAVYELPPGEEAKTLGSISQLWRYLRAERNGVIVAFGGGCTTDAAGFAAATYLRGIRWIAAPTTLVGQVDAAIGGKTAVNLPEGKNLVGAFHWPEWTLIDPALLGTLPERERRAGMAEVVKTGLLAGEPLWELPDAELVRRCAAYKAAVCLRDPYERGERAILNLGHTFAHALEAAGGYEVTHGEAVALGLVAALRLSGLDTAPVEETLAPQPVRVDRDVAWDALARDKKSRDGRPRLVLLEAPGKPVTGVELPENQVRAALNELIAD
jgi:shikimate kinase/3-dehydroquinate synthase